MTPGKDQIVLQASEQFKEALQTYAQINEISMAALIREAVADRIGYDLASDPKIERTRKYANADERKKAGLERARRERLRNKRMLQALKDGDHEEAARLAQADLDSAEFDKVEETDDETDD